MKTYVGQRVVCIDDHPESGEWGYHTPLIKGRIYTVRVVRQDWSVDLVEIDNPPTPDGQPRGYYHWHFGLPMTEEKSETTIEQVLKLIPKDGGE